MQNAYSEPASWKLRQLHRLDEDLGAAAIEPTPDDLREIDTAIAEINLQGARGTGHERYG